jgi:hypothetical protein
MPTATAQAMQKPELDGDDETPVDRERLLDFEKFRAG